MKLRRILSKKSGRSQGVVTVRHQGGRNKRFLREIDFKRSKRNVSGRVETIEVDPNPPVEEPKSAVIKPLGEILKESKAKASFSPALEANSAIYF